jgi:hypothetical protein
MDANQLHATDAAAATLVIDCQHILSTYSVHFIFMRTASLELQLAAQLHAVQTPPATRWCFAVRAHRRSAHDGGGWVPPLPP